MLSIEVKVNGNLISHAHVVNTGISVGGKSLYKVEYHLIGRGGQIVEFEVVHGRDEGVGVLCGLVYEELNKRLKK